MKILYLAHEHHAAQAAARALHRIAPNVRLTWAKSPGAALGWVRDNRDAGAVIVDAATQRPGCNAFLEEIRRLGVATPLAVIAPEHLEGLSAALKTSVDALVQHERNKTEILEAHLKEIEEWRRQAQQRLVEEQEQHDAALSRSTRICTGLQEQLLEFEAALRRADERHAAEIAATRQTAREDADRKSAAELASWTARLAEREAQHDASMARTNRICLALQERLLELESAIRTADERHAADSAATERLALRENELAAAVAEAIAARSALEHRLSEAESAHQRAASELTPAVERCAALEHQLSEQASVRSILEQRLAAAESARDDAEQEHATELAALNTRLADIEAQRDAAATENVVLERHLRDGRAALEDTRRQWQSEVTALTEQFGRREAEAGAALTEAIAARTAVERGLAEAESTHQQAQQRAAEAIAAAAERFAALEDRLNQESATRATLEEQLAAARIARENAAQQHATELASLTTRLADVQAQYDAAAEQWLRRETELHTSVAEIAAARTAFENRFADAEGAHQLAQQRSATELAGAAERYAAIEDRLNQEINTRMMLADRMAAAETARRDADQQHATELACLTTRLADVQAQYDAAATENLALERQLRDRSTALDDTRREWQSEVMALTEQASRREAETAAALVEASAVRTALEQRLAETESAHHQTQQRSTAEQAAATERYAALEDRLTQESAVRTTLEERLAAAETARQVADQQHATELASLTTRLADVQAQYEAAVEQNLQRETELRTSVAEIAAARTALEQRLAETESAHDQAQQRAAAEQAAAAGRYAALEAQLVAGSRDIAALRHEAAGLRRQLDAMRMQAAALRRDAERVPVVQHQLEESQKENRRQFERAPYGLVECTRDGTIIRANHSLTKLLGYRRSTELERRNFSTVFESADRRWLLERAHLTSKIVSDETTCRTRDNRRLFVRLHSLTQDGSIVIAVEDLTSLRAVEQRLREAHRLEAVGRVASEVAVTCDTLLRDVSQGGQQWLARFERDTPLRQQGEQLLGDVTRAAGFLRQFVVYGHEQISNLEPVSIQRVLHDMAPVLKRVLGDDITLVLPKTTDRFDVDVDAGRVERMLVTVANYARERMRRGGRVKIQLATTIVDRRFVASHPEVRPGPHVLITIAEIQGSIEPALPIQVQIADIAHGDSPRSASEKPGMDLGPLVALISSAGGHLWMSAEPAGNMTLQIHLPEATRAEAEEPAVAGSWSNRGRQLARWFRH